MWNFCYFVIIRSNVFDCESKKFIAVEVVFIWFTDKFLMFDVNTHSHTKNWQFGQAKHIQNGWFLYNGENFAIQITPTDFWIFDFIDFLVEVIFECDIYFYRWTNDK